MRGNIDKSSLDLSSGQPSQVVRGPTATTACSCWLHVGGVLLICGVTE